MKFLCFLFIVVIVQTAETQTWVKKVPANQTILGDALCSNPLDPSVVYGAPGGRQLYISRNRGYTWQKYGDTIPFVGMSRNVENVIKSIAVNPNDTLQILVGVESNNEAFDRVMKTTNGGQTWTQTLGGTFSYYGKPVEFKPVHPDTVYTMGNDTLWRSTNFGTTWDTVRRTTGLFSNWCDAEIRPDSANIIYLGDYHSGIWKTTDHGGTWRLVYSTSGEIPSIAIDPFNPQVAYATTFAGATAFLKTTNGGENWNPVVTPATCTAGWWVTCSQTNPGYVYFGVYGCNPGAIFLSADGGSTWRTLNAGFDDIGKINYGMVVHDSLTVLALQYNGIWRLNYPTSTHVLDPNGGEQFPGGTVHTVSWSSANLFGVKLEYSTNDGATWTKIVDSIDVSQTSYDWTLPELISDKCLVRVSDAYYTSAADTSDTTFTIFVDPLTLFAPEGGESWDANSTHFITWASHSIDSLRLEYSIDSGATWIEIGQLSASATHAYPWSIPNTPSQLCKVRISDLADSTVFRVSPSVFSIHAPVFFTGTIFLRDNALFEDSLVFGTREGATDNLDSSFGESALPPKPGQGVFDIRWMLPGGAETKKDFRDTLNESHRTNRYLLEFQPGPGGYPVTLTWKPDSMRVQVYILRDTLTHGAKLNIDLRHDSTVTIGDTSITALEIIQCLGRKITYQSSIDEWTLISLPLNVGDRRQSFLFPLSGSRAFTYAGSYIGKDSLERGYGYWMKIPKTEILGCDCSLDTIPIKTGWNLVGSIMTSVAVSSVIASPESLFASPFFGYDGAYFVADSIKPGSGYWLKSNTSGWIVLSSAPSTSKTAGGGTSLLNHLHSLRVADSRGHEQTLYFGEELPGVASGYFNLPPTTPHPLFDARFAPGCLVALHPHNVQNLHEYPLQTQTPDQDIFFSWSVDNEENFTYILITKDGNHVVSEVPMTGHGNCRLIRRSGTIFSVEVQHKLGNTETPHSFSLGQMYPNPFNPMTHVRYSVPSDAYVTVRVFSILGEEITRLVDNVRHAGEYDIEWNGTSHNGTTVGSGVYFIRMHAVELGEKLQASEYDAVRSVLLLK
ncbi:MAG: hypothetical protein HY033_08600 [Ignavibacteriae bacterium]|nr:hypothetical protein [Ignavibacteriota bacterium]